MASDVHGRSGSVALLRVKVVPASAARLVEEDEAALRVVRSVLLLSIVVDILVFVVKGDCKSCRNVGPMFQSNTCNINGARALPSYVTKT